MERVRRGFTLQAPRMMAVVLVILLAAVAVPTLRSTMAKRRQQQRLVAELTRLDSLETAHFTRFGFYTPNGGRVDARGFLPFIPAAGLEVIMIRADSAGWAAGARGDPDALPYDWHGCAVFGGPARYAPDPHVTTPHVPACW